jgi:hypothetical protein
MNDCLALRTRMGPCSWDAISATAMAGMVINVSSAEGARIVMGAETLNSEAPSVTAAQE